MNRLVVFQELNSRKQYRVSLPCIFGRGEEVDLVLSDDTVSHRHALLCISDDSLCIQDLNSLNGVFVNQQRVQEKAFLQPGDLIRLGQVELRLCQMKEDPSDQTVILHSVGPPAGLELDRQRLNSIYEITVELSENQDQTVLGEKIFSRLRTLFKQDQGYIALFQGDGRLKTIFSDPDVPNVPISQSIVNRLFQNGESFILSDALDEVSLKKQESILALRIRSALCVPLVFRDQIYGLMVLVRNVPGVYGPDDLIFLRTIALILTPLVENARLWAEIKSHYATALETLSQTQTRLLEIERSAAYARLAQAVAHEIRNPLMVIGGLVRRLMPSGPSSLSTSSLQAIISSVERVEMVLKEVDGFVQHPAPHKKLLKIDGLIQEALDRFSPEWAEHSIQPTPSIQTTHLMIPLDQDLFREALTLLFKDILSHLTKGSELNIIIRDSGNFLEIVLGSGDDQRCTCEPSDGALHNKPWSLGLFLNLAQKIISDHGGKLLLDSDGHSPLPMIIRLPRLSNG